MATYKPGRYHKTAVLPAGDRLLASRFSYGITPDLLDQVSAAGGARAWWDQQIADADPAAAAGDADWWPNQHYDAATIWQRQQAGVEGSWEVMFDYSRRLMARRLTTRQQVLEVMTEFWEGHFHVPVTADQPAFWRAPYGELIRQNALGRFEDLLQSTIVHPAMLLYLDAATSTKTNPNENLGRELLELHTVGVGHYTEDDVKAAARILTGWSVAAWQTWNATYRAVDHWIGAVTVGSFTAANPLADGRQVTRDLLTYLAHHPDTAQRVARKLAIKFVSDTPTDALVNRLAQVYLAHDTAIVPVLEALVDSAEFKASAGRKTRDPAEDLVASYRVIGADVGAPTTDNSAVNTMLWQADQIGLAPMSWPTPDGQPLDNQAWASPSRVLASMQVHWSLAGGWWPTQDISYVTPEEWLPQPRITFRKLVDHMSRRIHGRTSSAALLKVCCTAAACKPGEVITADHGLIKWGFPRLLGAFLDHPYHYER